MSLNVFPPHETESPIRENSPFEVESPIRENSPFEVESPPHEQSPKAADFGVDNIKAAGSSEGANCARIPNEVVFDGQLYTKISFSPANALQGDHSFLVAMQEGEDDFDPEEKGPEYLVFCGGLYEKCDFEPCLIPDYVPRVAKLDTQIPKLQAPSIVRPSLVAHPHATSVAPLQFGFDLLPNQRPDQFLVPTANNAPECRQHGRFYWNDTHNKYLWELIETAIGLLSRPIERKDFHALTEALHRKFRGTYISGVPYPERGYNTVHSYVMKQCKDKLNALELRVLGSTGGTGGTGGGVGGSNGGGK